MAHRRLTLLAVALVALLLPAGAHSDRAAPHGAGFWVQTNGPQGADGIAMAANPSGDVFVGTQGGGIFRSSDDGATWQAVNDGLTGTNVRPLTIDSDGDIFAGTFSGVFRSTDNGESWEPASNGIEMPFVISLVVDADDTLFALPSPSSGASARRGS